MKQVKGFLSLLLRIWWDVSTFSLGHERDKPIVGSSTHHEKN